MPCLIGIKLSWYAPTSLEDSEERWPRKGDRPVARIETRPTDRTQYAAPLR